MKTYKKNIIIITGIAILVAGIVCKQEFFLMIPLFISLFVMAFQSDANRLGALAGAINSLIYTAAYIYMGVYASAASAVLFRFPIQLGTFFSWRRHAYKKNGCFQKNDEHTAVDILLGCRRAVGGCGGCFRCSRL